MTSQKDLTLHHLTSTVTGFKLFELVTNEVPKVQRYSKVTTNTYCESSNLETRDF